MEENAKKNAQLKVEKAGKERKKKTEQMQWILKKVPNVIFISPTMLIITLNVHDLNIPNKRQIFLEWINRQTHLYVTYNNKS